jgi:hypothetical protein
MSHQDHLARAKEYIAQGDDFYRKAADEIRSAITNDGVTQTQAARALGRSQSWVAKLLARTEEYSDPNIPLVPFGGPEENEARYERHDKTVLRDPKRRAEALAALPAATRAEIAKQAMADPETRKQMRSDPEAEKIMHQHRSRVRPVKRRRRADRLRSGRRPSARSPPSTPTRPRAARPATGRVRAASDRRQPRRDAAATRARMARRAGGRRRASAAAAPAVHLRRPG